MSDERRICIVDANILFDFLTGDCIDLLFSLPFDIRTSDIVAHEVRFSLTKHKLRQLGLHIEEFDGGRNEKIFTMRRDHEELSIQDISVFLLAEEYEAYLISGDETLRTFGEAHSIECHGTIWFLEMMLQTNIISHHKAAYALRKMLEEARPPRRLPGAECEKRIKKWESME
jgi:hypothetical protein